MQVLPNYAHVCTQCIHIRKEFLSRKFSQFAQVLKAGGMDASGWWEVI